jgi:competence protein ComEC
MQNPTRATPDPPAPPRPIVPTALALVAGMALGLALPWAWWVWCWPAVLPTLATLYFLLRSRRIHGPTPPSGGLLLIAMIGVGGLLGSGLERADRRARADIPGWATNALIRAEGVVAEEPRFRAEGGVELVLRDVQLVSMFAGGPADALPGRLVLHVAVDAAAPLLADPVGALPLPGRPVRAWGRFVRADVGQTTPNPFNAWRYWRSRGIFGRLRVEQPADLELGPPPNGPWPTTLTALRGSRAWMAGNLARHLQGDDLALARALLLGESGLLGADSREAFARVGLSHLLAVSGLHTGFILLILLMLARLCWLSPRTAAWVGIVGLVSYAALTGFRPPVVRAATMGVFYLFGFAIGRFTTPLSSIAAAAFFTLLISPRNLLRLDWQLSYACALSIVLLVPPIYEWLTPARNIKPSPDRHDPPVAGWRRVLNLYILAPVAVSLAAQLGLAPIQIAIFQRFNPLILPLNLVGVPLTLLAVAGALLTGLFGSIPVLGDWAGALTHADLALLNHFVNVTASWRLAAVNVLPLPLWLTAVYLYLLLASSALRTGRERFQRLNRDQRASLLLHLTAAVAVLVVAPLLTRPHAHRRLDVYILDVGQGDCLVARFPNGQVMVVDAGAATPVDRGRTTVAPFLRTLGVDTIDLLVATHADADHIGGMGALLEAFPVVMFMTGADTADTDTYRSLENALAHEKGLVRLPLAVDRQAGFQSWGPDLAIRFIGSRSGLDDNNASVAILIDCGDVEILATGDLEAVAERRLLADGALIDVEALKVGHHGSRTSTSEDFLNVVRPEIALISAGRRNRYGHPAAEVVERLERHGARVLRTDLHGTIRLSTDGRILETFIFIGND